jgi:hypothetical protein
MRSDDLRQPVSDLRAELVQRLEDPSLEDWRRIKLRSEAVLSDAIANGDKPTANRAWFLDKIAETRLGFVQSFHEIKEERLYDAWCRLERVEISLMSFEHNFFLILSNLGSVNWPTRFLIGKSCFLINISSVRNLLLAEQNVVFVEAGLILGRIAHMRLDARMAGGSAFVLCAT